MSGGAALQLNDTRTLTRALTALGPARDELAGAGTGLLTLGPTAPLWTFWKPPSERAGTDQSPVRSYFGAP